MIDNLGRNHNNLLLLLFFKNFFLRWGGARPNKWPFRTITLLSMCHLQRLLRGLLSPLHLPSLIEGIRVREVHRIIYFLRLLDLGTPLLNFSSVNYHNYEFSSWIFRQLSPFSAMIFSVLSAANFPSSLFPSALVPSSTSQHRMFCGTYFSAVQTCILFR